MAAQIATIAAFRCNSNINSAIVISRVIYHYLASHQRELSSVSRGFARALAAKIRIPPRDKITGDPALHREDR
jgi:hypothetical protein